MPQALAPPQLRQTPGAPDVRVIVASPQKAVFNLTGTEISIDSRVRAEFKELLHKSIPNLAAWVSENVTSRNTVGC
ncbi:MAG: hypothetical protein IPO19_10905 [Rhodoferax sp.]|nr:hypothetical protein [Rhodoferax sp.]